MRKYLAGGSKKKDVSPGDEIVSKMMMTMMMGKIVVKSVLRIRHESLKYKIYVCRSDTIAYQDTATTYKNTRIHSVRKDPGRLDAADTLTSLLECHDVSAYHNGVLVRIIDGITIIALCTNNNDNIHTLLVYTVKR
jgi:hypothetical protein